MSDHANEPDPDEPEITDEAIEELIDQATAAEEAGVTDAAESPSPELTVEDLVLTLESVSTERDQYLDSLRRIQAEFENYKKAVAKRTVDERERANDKIVGELLPVLDACEGAVKNGSEDVIPVQNQLVAALERHGLEKSDPADQPFNPEEHEAVMHEPSDDVDEPTVAEVLRTGYLWKGRVLRPAMVRVKG